MNSDKAHQYKQSIAKSYSAAAETYDRAAFIEQQVSIRLLERLQYFNLQPQRILDIGCGTGELTMQLSNTLPTANITGVDIAPGMVKFAIENHKNSQIEYVCGDAESLPFKSVEFDLIISNCSIMCIRDLNKLTHELQRVLKPNGLLLFSTLGNETLADLALPTAWPDMHNIGDALLSAQLRDPVMESETLTLDYDHLADLFLDLQESGTYDIDNTIIFPELKLPYAAQYEVIYGHAWGSTIKNKQYKDAEGNVYISIDSIGIL